MTYREDLKSVHTKETHMSMVFLTDIYVYKLKKPIKLPYLDFRSLIKREKDCQMEIQLNRRLAPDTYLDVLPLTVDTSHHLHLGGQGKVVDWLVKMRRLDDSKMLDTLIKENALQYDKVRQAAEHLIRFYLRNQPEEMEPFAYWDKLLDDIRESYTVLLDQRFSLPVNVVKEVVTVLQSFLTQHDKLFEERVRSGKILEGHGDLRPEHICLEDKPVIFDCLEFSKEFRTVDTADELSFLAMECELMGNEAVGKIFGSVKISSL